MKELHFLAGIFFDFEVPRDRWYLFEYFSTAIEKQFLQYYFCFREVDYFTEHTGCFCQVRWLNIIKKRLFKILKLHADARKDMDLELLAKVTSGKMSVAEIDALPEVTEKI